MLKKQNKFLLFLKYELIANPMVWIFWLVMLFQVILFKQIEQDSYSFIFDQGLTSMWFLIFFIGGYLLTPWLMNVAWSGWTGGANLDYRDFIFTRAISRKSYFRAKAALYLTGFLSPFLLTLGLSFCQPEIAIEPATLLDDAQIQTYRERYLKIFPESRVITNEGSINDGDIIIPHGRPIKDLWVLLRMFLISIILQGFIIGISNLRFRRQLIWIGYAIPIIWMIAPIFFLRNKEFEKYVSSLSFSEESFLFFSSHMLLITLCTIAFGIAIQLFCERQFEKMEAV